MPCGILGARFRVFRWDGTRFEPPLTRMNTPDLLDALEYPSRSSFVAASTRSVAPEHAHIFRRAVDSCHLVGGFSLKPPRDSRSSESTPVVFVVEASSDEEADTLHRRIWNQNITPFVLVRTPEHLRLYSGFEYAPAINEQNFQKGLLKGLIRFDEVLTRLADFRASAIEDGSLWRNWGNSVRPEARVDWKLLANLKELGQRLHQDNLSRSAAHALIGKFVYLRYLRDRDILSNKKLAEWNIDPETIFSNQHLTIDALKQVISHVDKWLNGSIFPLPSTPVRQRHLREVAGVFLGNDATTRQLHLDFQAYDFSHIPIETLSIIYEQFLTIENRNEDSGAYYTPLPVVNFMLAELDAIHPLKIGMKVLDPSCGSGAFLVQCYRRLAEAHMQATKGSPKPAVLRDLLEKHIFGVDRDSNACYVAELSLVLTMLDYINPPDLTNITSRFKLPDLHNKNIFEADFFDSQSTWVQSKAPTEYSWVVGNPPWKQIKSSTAGSFARTFDWIGANRHTKPAMQNEAAEAFAWQAAEYCAPGGAVGMLLPAMTLFRTADKFRKQFFRQMTVHSVANFSNLREVLFAGRARQPAAAIFYSSHVRRAKRRDDTFVYSPLVVNQEANRPEPARRQDTWSIILNASEVRRLAHSEIETGDALPWKLALWGSYRDGRLLRSLESRFTSLDCYLESCHLTVSQGLELRTKSDSNDVVEPLPEVIGKPALSMAKLRRLGRIHDFPNDALGPIDPEKAYARKGRGILPLAVCRPPHIVVSADRRFAVFSTTFLVVPPLQIGIAGSRHRTNDLKLLALYLNSSFCQYHEFFRSPQGGIRGGRSTLNILKHLPVPIAELSLEARKTWLELHDQLIAWESGNTTQDIAELIHTGRSTVLEQQQALIDDLASDALGLTVEERILIDDLVQIRMPLVDGKVGGPGIGRPTTSQLSAYAKTLEGALNTFTKGVSDERHTLQITVTADIGVVEVSLATPSDAKRSQVVLAAESEEGQRLTRMSSQLSKRHSQWLYFDRNLFVYEDDRSYILKPTQLLWWSRSQALADADELIASFVARPLH